jgi:hypothetical protein
MPADRGNGVAKRPRPADPRAALYSRTPRRGRRIKAHDVIITDCVGTMAKGLAFHCYGKRLIPAFAMPAHASASFLFPLDSSCSWLRLLGAADRHGMETGPHRSCAGCAHEAPGIHALRRTGRRCGGAHRQPDGGRQAPAGLLGIHVNLLATVQPEVATVLAGGGPAPAGLIEKERAAFDALDTFYKKPTR